MSRVSKFAVNIGGKSRMLAVSGKEGHYSIQIDGGAARDVQLIEVAPGHYSLREGTAQKELFLVRSEDAVSIHSEGHSFKVEVSDARRAQTSRSTAMRAPLTLKAGMPGKISRVLVVQGEQVKPEQGLLVIEAMKMENEMKLGYEAVVEAILIKPGQLVETGAPLIRFTPPK